MSAAAIAGGCLVLSGLIVGYVIGRNAGVLAAMENERRRREIDAEFHKRLALPPNGIFGRKK